MTQTDELVHWVRCAATAADDKLAGDIVIIDVGEVFAVSDFFVIASGSNSRQVHAIADGIEEDLKLLGGPSPVRIEGAAEREWILIDYGAFVVHVFRQEQRDFYQLERLWGDRPKVSWEPSHSPDLAADTAHG